METFFISEFGCFCFIFSSFPLWGSVHVFTFKFKWRQKNKQEETPCLHECVAVSGVRPIFPLRSWRQHQANQWEKRHVTVTSGHLIVLKHVRVYFKTLINFSDSRYLCPNIFFNLSHSYKHFAIFNLYWNLNSFSLNHLYWHFGNFRCCVQSPDPNIWANLLLKFESLLRYSFFPVFI